MEEVIFNINNLVIALTNNLELYKISDMSFFSMFRDTPPLSLADWIMIILSVQKYFILKAFFIHWV